MRVNNVAVAPSRFRTALTRTRVGLKTVFANPKFHMGRVVKYGAIFAAGISLCTPVYPGVIPSLLVGLAYEGIRGRKVNAPKKIDNIA